MVITGTVLVLLLAGSAFFSASETALTAIGPLRVRTLAEQGHHAAHTLAMLLDDRNRLRSTFLVGKNMVNIAASVIATAVAIHRYGSTGIGIAAMAVTVAILVFGEILPKSIAIRSTERIALATARLIYLVSMVLRPIVTSLSVLSRLILRLAGGSTGVIDVVTEEEIRSLITLGHQQGLLEPAEEEILHSVFEFHDTMASEVMTPRLDVPAVELSESVDAAAKCILEHGVSRLAVYESTIDNLVGVVHIEDVLRSKVDGNIQSVKDLVRLALVVPESKSVGELFEQMRKQRISAAIVADEYGSTSGVITLEDLVEHIVGDLWDEHDPEGYERIQAVDERSSMIDGRLSIDEINEAFNTDLPSDYAHTLGGWIFHTLGRLPKPGDVVQSGGVEFRVETMDRWRVDRIRVKKL